MLKKQKLDQKSASRLWGGLCLGLDVKIELEEGIHRTRIVAQHLEQSMLFKKQMMFLV